MSITVTNGKTKMVLRDNNQLSAFLNNGWTQEQEKPVKEEAVKAEEPKQVKTAPKTTSKATTTRRRRTTAKAD